MHTRNPTVAWAVAAVAVLVAIALAVALIASGGDDDGGEEAGDTAQPAALADIARDPQPFEDRRVVVSGEIREVLADQRTFLLGPSGILVTAPPPIEVEEGDVAQVAGTLRRLDEDSLRDQLPAVARPRIEEFGGRPLLIATEIDTVEVSSATDPVALADVLRDPAAFLRSEVALEDAEISDVLDDRVAVLGGEGLVVAPDGGLRDLAPGDRVDVTGRAVDASPAAVLDAIGAGDAGGLADALGIGTDALDLDDYVVLIVADEVAPAAP